MNGLTLLLLSGVRVRDFKYADWFLTLGLARASHTCAQYPVPHLRLCMSLACDVRKTGHSIGDSTVACDRSDGPRSPVSGIW